MKWVGEFRDVPVSLVGGRTGKKEDSRISPVLGASGSDTFIYRFLFHLRSSSNAFQQNKYQWKNLP